MSYMYKKREIYFIFPFYKKLPGDYMKEKNMRK